MNKLQLLIETPRAGKWNHRFIVADDSTLSESEITKIISAARRNLQGDDYIAVSSETAQSVSGRKGKEILVLVGIDIKQLSDVERLKLEQKLANIDIETFVTETIDWNKDGKELLVCRSELTEWEKDFCSWSKFSYSEKKSLLSKLNSNKLKLIAGVVGILVVLGIGFLMTSFEDPKTKNIDGSENQSAENLTDNELGTPSTVTEETTAPLLSNINCDDDELFEKPCREKSERGILVILCENLQGKSGIQKSWDIFQKSIEDSDKKISIDKHLFSACLDQEKLLYKPLYEVFERMITPKKEK